MVIFVASSLQFSMNIHDNLKKKQKSQRNCISFFILFSTFHIPHKNLTISEGRGLHILGWDKAIFSYVSKRLLSIDASNGPVLVNDMQMDRAKTTNLFEGEDFMSLTRKNTNS